MARQHGRENEMLLGTLGNTLGLRNLMGTTKNEKISPPPPPTPKIEEKEIKLLQAFHWLYEIYISKTFHHHFQLRLIPLL
jgi:hypothetical protein